MSPHISSELIKGICATLQKLDEDFPSQADEPVVAELKRFLLLRIAELEAIESARANEASELNGPPETDDSHSIVWLRLKSR
jgi:hypothetical protein